VDDIVTVSEDEIVDAMRRLAYEARLVAEPSGAVAFAGYLYCGDELPSTRLNVAIVSGGNVEPRLLTQILTD
jgi:threonine dehydratase